MKPGTKFKLECEVRENAAWAKGLAVYAGGLPFSSLTSLMQNHKGGITDVVEPRRRFTDVDGTEYEVLQEGDKWMDGDMMHNTATGVRGEAVYCIGSTVFVGPNYKIGLRKVKA